MTKKQHPKYSKEYVTFCQAIMKVSGAKVQEWSKDQNPELADACQMIMDCANVSEAKAP